MVVSSKEPERGSVGSSVSELGTEERRESGLGESGTVEVGLNSVVCVTVCILIALCVLCHDTSSCGDNGHQSRNIFSIVVASKSSALHCMLYLLKHLINVEQKERQVGCYLG